jgi:hypothetical protein
LNAREARQYAEIVPRSAEKDPKDTPNRVFNKLAWQPFYGTEGVYCNCLGYAGDYAELIRSQKLIGWRQIFKGRWSIHWTNIQGRFIGEDSCDGTSPVGSKRNVAVIQVECDVGCA